MIRRIEPGGLEAWRLGAWMVILQPAAWRLGGLAAWGNDVESEEEDAHE